MRESRTPEYFRTRGDAGKANAVSIIGPGKSAWIAVMPLQLTGEAKQKDLIFMPSCPLCSAAVPVDPAAHLLHLAHCYARADG